MTIILRVVILAAFLAVTATWAGPSAFAGCPSYDPNCERPCPPGQVC